MTSTCNLERRKGGFYEDSESKVADITAQKVSEAVTVMLLIVLIKVSLKYAGKESDRFEMKFACWMLARMRTQEGRLLKRMTNKDYGHWRLSSTAMEGVFKCQKPSWNTRAFKERLGIIVGRRTRR